MVAPAGIVRYRVGIYDRAAARGPIGMLPIHTTGTTAAGIGVQAELGRVHKGARVLSRRIGIRGAGGRRVLRVGGGSYHILTAPTWVCIYRTHGG